MNKYTLGTILGSALLGLTKNKLGSHTKMKRICEVHAKAMGQINISFSIIPVFGQNYEKLVALTKRVWDHCFQTIKEEFFVTTMVSSADDYETDIEIYDDIVVLENGEWASYKSDIKKSKLRKR